MRGEVAIVPEIGSRVRTVSVRSSPCPESAWVHGSTDGDATDLLESAPQCVGPNLEQEHSCTTTQYSGPTLTVVCCTMVAAQELAGGEGDGSTGFLHFTAAVGWASVQGRQRALQCGKGLAGTAGRRSGEGGPWDGRLTTCACTCLLRLAAAPGGLWGYRSRFAVVAKPTLQRGIPPYPDLLL